MQYIVLPEFSTLLIIECNRKIQSVIDLPFWNLNCLLSMLSYLFDHFESLFRSI